MWEHIQMWATSVMLCVCRADWTAAPSTGPSQLKLIISCKLCLCQSVCVCVCACVCIFILEVFFNHNFVPAIGLNLFLFYTFMSVSGLKNIWQPAFVTWFKVNIKFKVTWWVNLKVKCDVHLFVDQSSSHQTQLLLKLLWSELIWAWKLKEKFSSLSKFIKQLLSCSDRWGTSDHITII